MGFPVYWPDTPDLPLPPGHRFPAQKYRLLRDAVIAEGIVAPVDLHASPLATPDQLTLAHDPAYVAAVLSGALTQAAQRRIGLPWSPILRDRSLATVGGTLAAARAALAGGVSGQLAGGTHHADASGGAGFCVFNDCAVATRVMRAERHGLRVTILDLDVHQGDGNALILADDRDVFVASVHGANNYPFTKARSSLDIALADGTGDSDYLAACWAALDAVLAFAPGLMLYIAGVDPLKGDRLGRLAVTPQGLAARDRGVLMACRSAGVPVVILAGGGYGDPISDTVEAYTATFCAARVVFG